MLKVVSSIDNLNHSVHLLLPALCFGTRQQEESSKSSQGRREVNTWEKRTDVDVLYCLTSVWGVGWGGSGSIRLGRVMGFEKHWKRERVLFKRQ